MTELFSQELKVDIEVLSLEEAVTKAVRSNPFLKAAEWKEKSAKEKMVQSGSWMDPVLKFGLLNVPAESFEFDREPMTGKQIALTQQIPFPGKLGAKKKAAEQEWHAVSADRLELERMLIHQVKNSYFDLYTIDKSIGIISENIDLTTRFVEIAERRYSVGTGLQQDVLKAQVEKSKFEEQSINLGFKREKATAVLNALMNRAPDTPILVSDELLPTKIDLTEEELMEKAKKLRPALKAARHRIDRNERMMDFSKKLKLPDLGVAMAYTQRNELTGPMMGEGADFLSMSVAFSLPIKPGNRQSSKVEESKAEVRMAQESYNNILNNVKRDIRIMFADVAKAKELIVLYENQILPQAEQSLNSALSGYQVNKVDFITLLNNQITLFNFRINYYRIISEHEKSIAGIEAAVGVNLTRGDSKNE
ncbi:MAG: TolC family protein [Candidatus Marinimicrobia bacterium]|nr:TolC family protein [Candidatus Neomarinimicrobiota bacterium]